MKDARGKGRGRTAAVTVGSPMLVAIALGACATEPGPAPAPPPPQEPVPRPCLFEDSGFRVEDARRDARGCPVAWSGRPYGIVFFPRGSDKLWLDSLPTIERQAVWLLSEESARVEIVGSSSAVEGASAEEAIALGERRASAVRDYLVQLGVPAERITVRSAGWDEPLDARDIEASHVVNQNASVEVVTWRGLHFR